MKRDKGSPVARDCSEKIARLLNERLVLIGTPIDDFIANWTASQLRILAKGDSQVPITLLVNSPGGFVTSSLEIHAAMSGLGTPVHTLCIGAAHGTAALLVAAGKKGSRAALPRALFQLCPIKSGGKLDPFHDNVAGLLARATGRGLEEVRADMARSIVLDARGALKYGLIDEIVDTIPFKGSLRS